MFRLNSLRNGKFAVAEIFAHFFKVHTFLPVLIIFSKFCGNMRTKVQYILNSHQRVNGKINYLLNIFEYCY
jgi:hypothetical protein